VTGARGSVGYTVTLDDHPSHRVGAGEVLGALAVALSIVAVLRAWWPIVREGREISERRAAPSLRRIRAWQRRHRR